MTRGRLSFPAHAGTNVVRFQERLSATKKLRPGRYTVSITAANAGGQHSSTRVLAFTIVR